MPQHTQGWKDRHLWLLLFLSLVVLFCVYRIVLPSPVFINLGTEGDERYLRKFWLREQSELYPFRWTKDSSYIQMPNLGSLPLEITLGADAPRPEGQPSPQVALIANGTILADLTMQNGLLAYRFLYHPPLFPLPQDLLLEVKSDTFVPSGDTSRALGIILNTVEVKPIISPLRLFQVCLLASLMGALSIALGYLLLRWLGVPQKKSLACGVVVLALLGFGIVKQFIVARFLLGAFGLLLVGYVLAILLEARGYREPLIAQLGRPWKTLKNWAKNLVSVIRNPYPLYVELKHGLNSFWLRWRLDLLISVGLLIVAIAVRLPYLMLIPQITDEGSEVRIALDIYRGERWPIIGSADYIGPLHNYLLALAFRLFGVSVHLPRLYMAILGTLTVVLTYWLGRGMASRLVGLVAACLMATSPTHILMNSHVAWSNCSSPFFTTLMLLALYAGVQLNSGPLLTLSGFLAGLSLQTHFSVLPIFPGAVLWFLWRRDLKRWFKQPWPYLTVVFALVAYSNMIWHNAHGRLHTLAAFQRRTDRYTGSPSWSDYMTNLWSLVLQLTSMMSGAMEGPDSLGMTLGLWPLIGYGILLLAGLFRTFRKGHSLPLAVIAPVVTIVPYINKDYHLPFTSRYTAPLLPLCYIAMAVPLADVLGVTSVTFRKTLLKRISLMVALLLCLVLLFYPLGPLFTYYQECMESGKSNWLLLNIVVELRQVRDSDIPIYLDHEMKHIRHAVNSIASKSLAYLLTLDGTNFEVIKLSETEASPVVTSKYGWWDYPSQVIKPSSPQLPSKAMLVLTQESYLTLRQVFELSPVIPIESEMPHSQGSYGLYRLGSRR
jgi:4-amino-4-deoxy-L-arabinose transferase-like glycosyltransferase